MCAQKKTFNDFTSVVTEVLNYCEWTSNDPKSDPDVWTATMDFKEQKFFVIKKKAGPTYFEGLSYIRNEVQQKNLKISEGYVNKSFVSLLKDLKKNNRNVSNSCQTFLNGLSLLIPKKYKFLFPINHYDYRRDIKVGNIEVIKLTDARLSTDFSIPNEMAKVIGAKKLIKDNETDVFAIVEIESLDDEYSLELGEQTVKKFIYATKLIDPGSYIRLRKDALKQVNEDIVHTTDGVFGFSGKNYNIPVRIIPSDSFYSNLQKYWNGLMGFLFQDNSNDLQEAILSSLYWYGETDYHFDPLVRSFLNYVTSLERLVLHNHSAFGKSVPFGRRCSILFSGGVSGSEQFWKDYYLKRNNILHQKLVTVFKEDIDTLMNSSRSLLLHFVDLVGKYTTVNDLLDKEFGIK